MYVKKRDQLPNVNSACVDPPVMHRRFSHRPRTFDVLARNEPHPSVVQSFGCMTSPADALAASDEVGARGVGFLCGDSIKSHIYISMH